MPKSAATRVDGTLKDGTVEGEGDGDEAEPDKALKIGQVWRIAPMALLLP